jgi:hypothetical protein
VGGDGAGVHFRASGVAIVKVSPCQKVDTSYLGTRRNGGDGVGGVGQ